MNRGYDPFHLVNTYGAFGSITKKRNELVVLGTLDSNPKTANWSIYEFKGKPSLVDQTPTSNEPLSLAPRLADVVCCVRRFKLLSLDN